jgi:predicted DNA-binding protein with PD1-like motif
MKVGKISNTQYILRLERGEEVVSTLTAFCGNHGIKNAWLTGLGSIGNPTLAHYKVDNKKYSEKKIEGIFEVTNFTGNIALFEGKPLLHPHITLGDENMQALSGHLVHGTVSATMEIKIEVLPTEFTKSMSEAIGLKLFDLSDE